jgi:hypothetical protein
MHRYLVIGLAVILFVASAPIAGAVRAEAASGASPCQFQKSTSAVAFCDTFDHAASTNESRSGALDPTVWGVSQIQADGGDRYNTGINPPQGPINTIAPVSAGSPCGGTVLPADNVQICNGQLFDSVDDDGGQTVLAMYPRQPFDIAGRTGDVTFNVSDNSQGIHAAWPTLVYTDQPVPAPYSLLSAIETSARNSFGITFAQQCGRDGVTVDSMFETAGYVLQDVPFTQTGCVQKSTSPTQQNHVEVLMSQSEVQVWASDAGSSALREIADARVTMPLTRGLLWMEDAHYNGDKYDTQQSDTFGWSDFGFDGPVLPRDLGFDVPNRDLVNSDGSVTEGWATNNHASATVHTRADDPVTQGDISAASAALVEFDWFAYSEQVPTVSLNGNPIIATAWPFNSDTYSWRTIAVPVPLSEVVTGRNSISVTGAPGGIANFDLILAGAGGVPACLDPSTCASSQPSPASIAPHRPLIRRSPRARPRHRA